MASGWKKILKAATEQGWREVEKKKGLMLYPPDKTKSPVMVHKTPSDHRALANTLAEMKRQGLVWPWPRREGK